MPTESNFLERQIFEAIQSKIMHWVHEGAPLVMLNPPPFVVTRGKPDIRIRELPAEPLPALHGIGGTVRLRQWHDRNLNSYNIPFWGCVMDGEADLVVGVTQEMCQSSNLKPGRWIITLPPKTLFWMPPDVPITMSGRHWERPNPEKAHARIFWMHITPTGGNCHFCSTVEGKHWVHPFYFVSEKRLWTLAQSVLDEFKEQSHYHQVALESYMELILLLTMRRIRGRDLLSRNINQAMTAPASEGSELIVQHALYFINDCFKNRGLTTTDVAAHVHLSVAQLGRLFRKHLQRSVWQVIVDKRFEQACQLLEQSTFNVRQIGHDCGYAHSSTFVAAFEKKYGMSPLAYRRQHQKQMNDRTS